MKKYDVVALGELLIDFTDNGLSTQGNRLFEANPGGAPCNMLAMLEKLGDKTAFIGKVGNDFLGRMLKEKITAAGINADRLFLDDKIPTTLAFVGKRPDGDRDFAFFRKPGADMMLTTEEAVASAEIIRSSRLFHFGTLSLTDEPVRSATKKAVDIARDSGLLISFDPNYREPLWHSRNDARKAMEYGFSVCDILKIADNEIEFYTGETDIASGAEMIQQKFAIPVVFATSGAAGSSEWFLPQRAADHFALPLEHFLLADRDGAASRCRGTLRGQVRPRASARSMAERRLWRHRTPAVALRDTDRPHSRSRRARHSVSFAPRPLRSLPARHRGCDARTSVPEVETPAHRHRRHIGCAAHTRGHCPLVARALRPTRRDGMELVPAGFQPIAAAMWHHHTPVGARQQVPACPNDCATRAHTLYPAARPAAWLTHSLLRHTSGRCRTLRQNQTKQIKTIYDEKNYA